MILDTVIFFNQLYISIIFKCLNEQNAFLAQNLSQIFDKIDQILSSLGFTEDGRHVIYSHLAAILHLGNIEFEASDSGAQINQSSKKHITIASKLMNISYEDIEESILYRTINVCGKEIP